MGSTLRSRPGEFKEKLTTEFWSENRSLFEERRLLPIIDRIFDWNQVADAHKYVLWLKELFAYGFVCVGTWNQTRTRGRLFFESLIEVLFVFRYSLFTKYCDPVPRNTCMKNLALPF
jgi:hypothetical protein